MIKTNPADFTISILIVLFVSLKMVNLIFVQNTITIIIYGKVHIKGLITKEKLLHNHIST